jgi:hypothetical protein
MYKQDITDIDQSLSMSFAMFDVSYAGTHSTKISFGEYPGRRSRKTNTFGE